MRSRGNKRSEKLGINKFWYRLTSSFGWRYVVMVILVYGVVEGVGSRWVDFAEQYIFTDAAPYGLNLYPARFSALHAVSLVPWQLKAVFGVCSDVFPIFGMHYTPYLVIGSLAGLFAFTALSILPLNPMLATIGFFFGRFSIALPDVIIDASVARRCKSHPHLAPDLQTLCTVSSAVMAFLLGCQRGRIYNSSGSRGLLAATILTPMVVIGPALFGWMTETRDPSSPTRPITRFNAFCSDPQRSPMMMLAVIVSICTMVQASVGALVQDPTIIAITAIVVSIVTASSVYILLSRVCRNLASVSLFVLLSNALQPSTPVLFYWMKATPDNCDGHYGSRPCFSPELINWMGCLMFLVAALAAVGYNTYLTKWSYRKTFVVFYSLLGLANLMDVIWVKRLNLFLGIPDGAFIFGEEIVGTALQRLTIIPSHILAARLCPDSMEGTLFALNMGLGNLGRSLGAYMGIGILGLMGGVKPPDFANLELLVMIRAITRFTPILLVWLVPRGGPCDIMIPAELDPISPAMRQTPLSPSKSRNPFSPTVDLNPVVEDSFSSQSQAIII